MRLSLNHYKKEKDRFCNTRRNKKMSKSFIHQKLNVKEQSQKLTSFIKFNDFFSNSLI